MVNRLSHNSDNSVPQQKIIMDLHSVKSKNFASSPIIGLKYESAAAVGPGHTDRYVAYSENDIPRVGCSVTNLRNIILEHGLDPNLYHLGEGVIKSVEVLHRSLIGELNTVFQLFNDTPSPYEDIVKQSGCQNSVTDKGKDIELAPGEKTGKSSGLDEMEETYVLRSLLNETAKIPAIWRQIEEDDNIDQDLRQIDSDYIQVDSFKEFYYKVRGTFTPSLDPRW